MRLRRSATLRQVQRPRQLWIVVVVLGIAVLMWAMFIVQIGFGRAVGTHPMPDAMLVVFWLVFGIGFPVLWWNVRLIVEVDDNHVLVSYMPFVRREIPYAVIREARSLTYQPQAEFGGWGIRMWLKRRRVAYSVSGNEAVELILSDQRSVVIGSQDSQALADAINARLG